MKKAWLQRLTQDLEPVLLQEDPRPSISAYHDMPFAIFRYSPQDEFSVREQLALLRVRLEQAGKRVTVISLAECMHEALVAEGFADQALVDAEATVGLEATIETIHQILSDYQPLDSLVLRRFPPDGEALRDVVFIVRAGALFPFYRTSSLLEQLRGGVDIPAVLFYPGELDGAAGLRFMGVLEAEHNYRPRIF
jgi:hypothetical protein